MEQILTILINNGIGVACAAAVLWFAWWRETHTIPSLTKAFGETQATFTSSIAQLQDKFNERNAAVMATFTELVREERRNYERWHVENRDRLDRMFEELKESRHYMRDLANQIGLKQAVEDQRTKSRGMKLPNSPGTEGEV